MFADEFGLLGVGERMADQLHFMFAARRRSSDTSRPFRFDKLAAAIGPAQFASGIEMVGGSAPK